MSIKTDNLIVDFKSKTQAIIKSSNADPKAKQLVTDITIEVSKLLEELLKEIE